MNGQLESLSVHRVFFYFHYIVGHVVDLAHAQGLGAFAEDFGEGLAGPVGQALAIGPGIVGGAGHGCQVVLAFLGVVGGTGQLPIGDLNLVFLEGPLHDLEEVGAYLVAETPGARVDHDGDLPLLQPHGRGQPFVEDLLHHLDLQEVVPRAQGAQLVFAPLLGLAAHQGWVRSGDTAPGLGVVQVLGPAVALLHSPGGPFP